VITRTSYEAEMGDVKQDERAYREWLASLAEKAEFEQKVFGDMREIRMVIPTIPGVPLKDYTVKGEEARHRIAKFVLAMSAGYCRMLGAGQLEVAMMSIAELVTGDRRAGLDEEPQ
jgi:hypothetical protein